MKPTKKPDTRTRSAKSGEYVKTTGADPDTTVTERRHRALYSGWMIFAPGGKPYDATVHRTCAAAWNVAESQTGSARRELEAIGYVVFSVSVIMRVRP